MSSQARSRPMSDNRATAQRDTVIDDESEPSLALITLSGSATAHVSSDFEPGADDHGLPEQEQADGEQADHNPADHNSADHNPADTDTEPRIRICELSLSDERFVVISMPVYDSACAVGLTPGERDIVARILLGQSNQEIANARGSRLSTVSNQVYSIFDKLGVESRTQLAERMVPRTSGR